MTRINHTEFFAHFPDEVSQEIVDYATNTVFLHARYIFVHRVGKVQYGYCTHCKNEFRTSLLDGKFGLKHGDNWVCPECNSQCIVRHSGKGRKILRHQAYFVWYERSKINPQAITARGIYTILDLSRDYRYAGIQFRTQAMYLFEPGQSTMLRLGWKGWEQPKSIISEMYNSMKSVRCFTAEESIVQAVQGTPFQYSTWEKYVDRYLDMVNFFDLAAKYPCIEYLTKMGLRGLVEAKLNEDRTFNAINWRGKTINKVLRLNKQEIRDLCSLSQPIRPLTLHAYQYYKKLGMKLTFEQTYLLQELVYGYYFDEIKKLITHASFEDLSRYALKQLSREKPHYRRAGEVITALRDYWKQCEELGMDLSQDHVKFPNNLHTAHQKTIQKIKIKEDQAVNAKIVERAKELVKFKFEHNGLFVRPAASSQELFDEGQALNHCVGSYAKKYAEGKCDLFFIRRSDKPDTPFYTMEIIDGNITQCYGKNNCQPTKKVQAFLEVFKSKKLAKKKRQNFKATERQEVAV